MRTRLNLGGRGGRGVRRQAHLNGMRGIYGDLVVGLVPMRQPEVVVFGLHVHVREDELRHKVHRPSAGASGWHLPNDIRLNAAAAAPPPQHSTSQAVAGQGPAPSP